MKTTITTGNLPMRFASVYNEFVDIANKNNLLFESFEVKIGDTTDGQHDGIVFEIDAGINMTELNRIFGDFIKRNEPLGISNKWTEQTDFEKTLIDMGVKVLRYREGVKLEKIKQQGSQITFKKDRLPVLARIQVDQEGNSL